MGKASNVVTIQDYDTFEFMPTCAGGLAISELHDLLAYVNKSANGDCDSDLAGVSAAALALLDKVQDEIEHQMRPLLQLKIIKYTHCERNQEAGVAGKFVRFEAKDDAPFQIIPKMEAANG